MHYPLLTCSMFHRSIDSLLKPQKHQKKHKKKTLNWLKLIITKQVQVQEQVMKDVWYLNCKAIKNKINKKT